MALRKYLALRGKSATLGELSRLAGTDGDGTTMQGLIDAANAKGVTITGVQAESVADLPRPFIAYVNENHFVVVRDVREDEVAVSDMGRPETLLPLSEFARVWQGKMALVDRDADALADNRYARLLDAASLKGAKGGCYAAAAPSAAGPPISAGTSSGLLRPIVDTGIVVPGVHVKVNQFESCLALSECDTSVGVLGRMALSFRRTFINEKGYFRGETTGASVWQNNIGKGWAHNLNMHLVASTGSPPTSVVLYDEEGSARTYNYDSTSGGYNYYYRSSTGQTGERGNTLARDTSTLKYYLIARDDTVYGFSAATTDANRVARLETITDRDDNVITLSYNGSVSSGKLTKVSSPTGDNQHLSLSYAGNRVTKVELKNDANVIQTTTYAYNASNELTRVTDNDSKTVQYAYASDAGMGSSRFITKITDKMGRECNLTWTFGANGSYWEARKIDLTNTGGLVQTFDRSVSTSVCTVSRKDGMTVLRKGVGTPATGDSTRGHYGDSYRDASNYDRWAYEYDGSYNDRTKYTGPGGTTLSEFTYNDQGSPLSRTSNLGITSTTYYDATGLIATKVTNPAALDTTYDLDGANRITKLVTSWSGANGTQFTYDANGLKVTTTTPLGDSRVNAYDALGRMTTSKDPLNNQSSYAYDNAGRITQITDPRGKTTNYHYASGPCSCGSSGSLTKVTDALGNDTEYEYDANGNKTRVTDAMGLVTDYSYDLMNRLTRIESPSGSGIVTTMAYDKQGQLTSRTDSNGETTTYGYDYQGKLTQVNDSVGTVAQNAYDNFGNLTAVTDGNGNTTNYAYDGDHRLTQVSFPGGKTVTNLYDGAGRMTKTGAGAGGSTDPVQNFYDDDSGLMTKTGYTAGGSTVYANYFIDADGEVTKVTDWTPDGANGLRSTFDSAGRLSKLTEYDDTELTYTYDADGNVLTMEDYHGNDFVYTYTDTGGVSTVTAPGNKTWSYSYNDLDQVTQVSIPNGMTVSYAYDDRNRLTQIQYKDGDTVEDGFTFALDNEGNITTTTYQDDSYWEYYYDGRSAHQGRALR
jgi:YD repeat-containing protein